MAFIVRISEKPKKGAPVNIKRMKIGKKIVTALIADEKMDQRITIDIDARPSKDVDRSWK